MVVAASSPERMAPAIKKVDGGEAFSGSKGWQSLAGMLSYRCEMHAGPPPLLHAQLQPASHTGTIVPRTQASHNPKHAARALTVDVAQPLVGVLGAGPVDAAKGSIHGLAPHLPCAGGGIRVVCGQEW